MDFELRAAKQKWELEQKQRKEQALARLAREKKAKEEASRQREALETAQRIRREQAAEAAITARQQEENDFFAGDGVRFNILLQAALVAGEGDKIRLPPSVFEHLSSQGALEKGPMFFEITLVDSPQTTVTDPTVDHRSTHAGVLQFTAPEGFAELPRHVSQNLGLSQGMDTSIECPLVRIRYVRLPKCIYAKLQPEASDFVDVPNHKAVLETKLRQHATLSEGDVLTVQYGGVDYALRILELRPASNASVLETDMEVDVVAAAVAGTNSNNRLLPLEMGKPESGFVDEGCYKYYKFSVDEKQADAATCCDVDIVIHLEVDGGGATSDADLYVALHPVLFPTQHQHQWSSHDIGSKVICLTGPGKTVHASSYSIGIYGYRGKANYKIWVDTQPSRQPTGQRVGSSTLDGQDASVVQTGFELCGNCKQVIPSRTFALHEAYCRRHNAICNHPGCGVVLRREELDKHVHCLKCGQSFQQEELPKHMKVYHEPQSCKCGAVLEKEEMFNHQATSCPLRMIMCRFCGDMVQAGADADNIRDKLRGLTQHECVCGSRTTPCDSCGRAVMLKEMDLHRAASHDPTSQAGKAQAAGATVPQPHSAPAYGFEQVYPEALKGAGSQVSQEEFKSLVCPICSLKFWGQAAERELNTHLDSEHFAPGSNSYVPTSNMHDEGEAGLASELSFRSSRSVSCPICGLAVHSERDLSSHMDMVH